MDNNVDLTPKKRFQITIFLMIVLVISVICMLEIFQPSVLHAFSQKSNNQSSSETKPRVLSKSEQLFLFNSVWKIVDLNYLYPNFNGLDWKAIQGEYSQMIMAGLSEADFYAAMQGLIAQLGDGHSRFIPPAKYADANIGTGFMDILIPGMHYAIVTFVRPHSAAEDAGIKTFDRILAVDYQLVPDDVQALGSLLTGSPGEKIVMTVQTPGQNPRQVEIILKVNDASLPVPYKVWITSKGKHIGYMVLASFAYGNLGNQITEAINSMSADTSLDGLILDVRLNSGGDFNVVKETLSFFTNGIVGYTSNRNGTETIDIANRAIHGSDQIPLVVLIAPMTASGGESFAGLLQDVERAYLIGETTLGNVELARVHKMFDGSTLVLAQDAINPLHHPDQTWEGKAVIPDLAIDLDLEDFMSDNDPVIIAALEYLDR